MHQITACSLYKLLKAAYTDYSKETDEQPEEVPSFEAWCEQRKQESPQFHSWYMVLSKERVILLLIQSFREANFSLCCQSLAELIPYFFANSNVHYARWLPNHYRDMVTLEQKHPQLAQEFQSGNFDVHKSSRQFSAMVIDQAHEQANTVNLKSQVSIPEAEPYANTIIIDGAALVNSLPPRSSQTFEEYAMLDFRPTIKAYSIKYKRTDIVLDVFFHTFTGCNVVSAFRGEGNKSAWQIWNVCNEASHQQTQLLPTCSG